MGRTFYIILNVFLTFYKVHLYDETKGIIELRPLVTTMNLKNKPSSDFLVGLDTCIRKCSFAKKL